MAANDPRVDTFDLVEIDALMEKGESLVGVERRHGIRSGSREGVREAGGRGNHSWGMLSENVRFLRDEDDSFRYENHILAFHDMNISSIAKLNLCFLTNQNGWRSCRQEDCPRLSLSLF